ncbi:MAG: sugar-binding protein [Verrucomicrobiota bacterium]|nr:sugar-binding protein [Verrucomicrobiota bacterium]
MVISPNVRYAVGMRFTKLVPLLLAINSLLPVLCLGQLHTSMPEKGPYPWTQPLPSTAPQVIRFAILADRTGGHRPGVWEKGIAQTAKLYPDFVTNVGDLIEGYSDKPAEINAMWDEFDATLKPLPVPFLRTAGNHDVSTPVQQAIYKERYGADAYWVRWGDYLFVYLSSSRNAEHKIVATDVDFVKAAFQANTDARWTVFFSHCPLWQQDTKTNGWDELEQTFGDRKLTAFSGHYHEYFLTRRNGRNYYNLATTGGDSSVSGVDTGLFDHITWVVLTPEGPLVTVLPLDGIVPDTVRTEKTIALQKYEFVQPEVIWMDGKAIANRPWTVKFTNPLDTAINLKFKMNPNEGVTLDPTETALTLQPGANKSVVFTLTAKGNYSAPGAQLGSGHWSMECTDAKDGELLKIGGDTTLGLASIQTVARQKSKVIIDGKLDEWAALPFNLKQPQLIKGDAPADSKKRASLQFAVTDDSENVYVAVKVSDSEVTSHKDKIVFEQDSVEVRVNANPLPSRAFQLEGQKNMYLWALAPGETQADSRTFLSDMTAKGSQCACIPQPYGYSVEISIPKTVFADQPEGPEKGLRIDVTLNDITGKERVQYWWTPYWGYAENYAGSGEFRFSKK